MSPLATQVPPEARQPRIDRVGDAPPQASWNCVYSHVREGVSTFPGPPGRGTNLHVLEVSANRLSHVLCIESVKKSFRSTSVFLF